MWLRVHKLARTWRALMSVGLTVVGTSAGMSVWRVALAHQTRIWTYKLTSVSPGEWLAWCLGALESETGVCSEQLGRASPAPPSHHPLLSPVGRGESLFSGFSLLPVNQIKPEHSTSLYSAPLFHEHLYTLIMFWKFLGSENLIVNRI